MSLKVTVMLIPDNNPETFGTHVYPISNLDMYMCIIIYSMFFLYITYNNLTSKEYIFIF